MTKKRSGTAVEIQERAKSYSVEDCVKRDVFMSVQARYTDVVQIKPMTNNKYVIVYIGKDGKIELSTVKTNKSCQWLNN